MVFFTTRCRMLVSRYENKGLVNCVEISQEFQFFFFIRPPLKLYFRSNQNKSNEAIHHSMCFCNSSIQKNPHSQPPYQAQLGLIGTVVQCENECACCVGKHCVFTKHRCQVVPSTYAVLASAYGYFHKHSGSQPFMLCWRAPLHLETTGAR